MDHSSRVGGDPAAAGIGGAATVEPGGEAAKRFGRMSPWLPLVLSVALVGLVAVAFAPVLGNGFVHFDDDENFEENADFRGLGPSQLVWAWRTFLLGVYQPLAWILLEAQYTLWGLDPRGYHLASLAMHGAVVVALYALTVVVLDRALPAEGRRDRRKVHIASALATAFFALHPLRAEVVAWASCQPYLPCAFFYILSVLAYLRANPAEGPGPSNPKWLLISLGLFLAALLSKAVAVTLPAVLVILDFYPLRRLRLGRGGLLGPQALPAWREKIPFVLLGAGFMAIAIWAKWTNEALISVREYGPVVRVAQSAYGACFYLLKTVIPAGLSAYCPTPRPFDWAEPRFLASLAALVGLTAAVAARGRRYPGLVAAWAAYLLAAAPNLGLMRIGNQIAADRYSYVPIIPSVFLMAYGLIRLGKTPRRFAALAAIVLALVAANSALAWRQCLTWRTTGALWDQVVRHEGRLPTALFNLGAVRDREGRYGEAKALYLEAIEIDPACPDAHNMLGASLDREGKPDEALAEFREALRLEPEYASAHNNLGAALARRGQAAKAELHFREALRIRPNFPLARSNLALSLSRRGRYREAAEHFGAAVAAQPGAAPARLNLGLALVRLGKFAEAAEQFAEAARLKPDDPAPRINLGLALIELGRSSEAIPPLTEATRIDPASAEAQYLLGGALAELGRPDEAASHFREALRLDPEHAEARRGLDEASRRGDQAKP